MSSHAFSSFFEQRWWRSERGGCSGTIFIAFRSVESQLEIASSETFCFATFSILPLAFFPSLLSLSLSRALRRSASALYASPPPPVVYSPNTQIFYAFSGQFVFTERTSSRSFGSNRKLRLFYRRGRKLFKTCCAQRSIGFSFVIESIIVIPLVSPLTYSS